MKKFFLPILLFLIYSVANAQTTQTWDFEEGCSDFGNSFFLGCIPNAISTHGTPDTEGETNMFTPPPFEGTRYAHAYSRYQFCSGSAPEEHGEGFALNFTFKPNKTYSIEFHVRGNQPPGNPQKRLEVILTNGLPNFGGYENAAYCDKMKDRLPSIPSGAVVLGDYSSSVVPTDYWAVKNITVTSLSQVFGQLWFRPRTIHADGTNIDGWDVYVDHVVVTECEQANFDYSLCKVGANTVRVSVSGTTGTTGQWKLIQALSCSGGTGDSNLGASQGVTWSNNSLTEFNIPFNSGCYVLEQIIPASGGCPEQRIRKLIDSNYAPGYSLSGAFLFQQITPCTGALNYLVNCIPSQSYQNGVDYWTITDLTTQTTATYSTTGTLSIYLTSSHVYRIEHQVRLEGRGITLCVLSDIGVFEARCTNQPGMVVKSTTLDTPVNNLYTDNADRSASLNIEASGNFAVLAPNPMVSDYVMLKTNGSAENAYEVTVYDLNGRVMHAYHKVTDTDLRINRESMSSGIYFVKVANGSGFQKTLKLVVQ